MTASGRVGSIAVAWGLTVVLAGLGGWFIGSRDDSPKVDHGVFAATVESVAADGREGCFRPIDPAELERFGGSMCGNMFVASGVDPTPGTRVHVRWFIVEGSGFEQTVDTYVLEPPE